MRGTVLHLNAETPPRLIPLIAALADEPCALIAVTAAERIDVTTRACSAADDVWSLLDRFIRVGAIVGGALGPGMAPDDPDARREFNVDIPDAVGHLALQLFLTATPAGPLTSQIIADLAELIRAVDRDIAPMRVQTLANGVAGNISLISLADPVDETGVIEAVRTAAGHARALPEWKELSCSGLEWSPEVWVSSPVYLSGRVPLWETAHQEPGSPFEKKLRDAVTVRPRQT